MSPLFHQSQVLFEDNHLLVVNKLPSQIVQGDKTGDVPLSELAARYIGEKYHKPGNVFMGVVHRLDRPVSGVVLFARTSKALSRMNEIFRERRVKKTYWAVVRDFPAPPSGTLVHYMIKNEKTNTSKAYTEPRNGALRSELAYQLLYQGKSCSLLEVLPLTGRHHQIRAQLAAAGWPIIGDVKYGDKRANEDRSICLHARKLEFIHPVSRENITVEAPLPRQKYWDVFSGMISTGDE